MKCIALAILACLSVAMASCGDPQSKRASAPATFAAQEGTPKEQLLADMQNGMASSFRAEYKTTVKPVAIEGGLHPSATWYKDGVARQRFDLRDAYEFLHADAATIFMMDHSEDEDIVVCSDSWPLSESGERTQPPGGACFDSSDSGDVAAYLLYLLGFPLGFKPDDTAGATTDIVGGLDSVDVAPPTRRVIAGTEARCFELTAASPDEEDPNAKVDLCVSPDGVPLYWHIVSERMGEVEVEATRVSVPDDDDFEYPYEVYRPTPEPYVPYTPVPPIHFTVRLRLPSGAAPGEVESALAVIRRRIATGPSCWSIPFKETDQCITTERIADEYVLSFDASSSLNNITDTARIGAWLSVRGEGRVRLRFCEALQDTSGSVATIPDGKAVVYKQDTCDPIVNAQGQVQLVDEGGSTEWTTPDYVSIEDAQLDNMVWSPAIGDLRGEHQAMTDAYLDPDASPFQPLTDNPDPDVGWRAIYNATDDGEVIIRSITARLAPKSRTLTDQRTAMKHGYPIAFFLDGQPIMGTDGQIAVFRVFLADFPPQLIDGLSRDTAYRVAAALNGPALELPVEVVSVTRDP